MQNLSEVKKVPVISVDVFIFLSFISSVFLHIAVTFLVVSCSLLSFQGDGGAAGGGS